MQKYTGNKHWRKPDNKAKNRRFNNDLRRKLPKGKLSENPYLIRFLEKAPMHSITLYLRLLNYSERVKVISIMSETRRTELAEFVANLVRK